MTACELASSDEGNVLMLGRYNGSIPIPKLALVVSGYGYLHDTFGLNAIVLKCPLRVKHVEVYWSSLDY